MSGTNGVPSGFNADERARKREEGPITIGGQTYHPRRLTNKRLREIRTMARAAGREAEALAKTTSDYREAYDEAIADGREEKEAREVALEAGLGADEAQDLSTESLTRQLGLLLVDDNAQPVPEERIRAHLDDDLDSREVEGLMGYLLGTPDPTTTPATSGS